LISNSNFIKEGMSGFIGISVPYNTTVMADNNLGLTGNYALTSQKGNSISIKNSLNSPLKDIGCGFGVARSGRKEYFDETTSDDTVEKIELKYKNENLKLNKL